MTFRRSEQLVSDVLVKKDYKVSALLCSFIVEREAFVAASMRTLSDLELYLDVMKKFADKNVDEWEDFKRKRVVQRQDTFLETLHSREEGAFAFSFWVGGRCWCESLNVEEVYER